MIREHSPNPAAHSAPASSESREIRIAHLAQRALLLAVAIRNTDVLLVETRKC
jgi:hypothetical protein